MGDEAEREARLRDARPYQVERGADGRSHARTRSSCTACPPIAARRSTAEVIDGPRSVVWQQAENRLPTEEAMLLALIARRWEA